MQTGKLAAVIGVALVIPALTTAASADASPAPTKLAQEVVSDTDSAPVVAARDSDTIAGHAIYASFSDRRTRLAATYLDGKLAQATIDTTLYVASGACFKHEPLTRFTGLSRIAITLLPLPTAQEPVHYRLAGHELRWREPATRQRGPERGAVTFDARHRIASSRIEAHDKIAAQTLTLTYPPRLPRSVPASPPRPACAPSKKS